MTDVLVDLGRSHVRVVSGGTDRTAARGAGLGDPAGPVGAARVVLSAVRDAGVHIRGARLAVCAPGVLTSPRRATAFADALTTGGTREVLVASDSSAWHAGAFAGADGAAVALGTGAVVTVVDAGDISVLDGLGLLLGDVGGGAWIGLAALRQAARGAVALRAAATARFGDPTEWPALLGSPEIAACLAAFVPDVLALAADDAAAAGVLDAAADGLADTLAPVRAGLPICLVGGLAPVLADRLRSRLDRPWAPAVGDAVDGLRLLLQHAGAFERMVVRRPGVDVSSALVNGAADTDAISHETDLLPTEATAPDTADLDTWPTERLVERLVAGHAAAVPAVHAAAHALSRAADLAAAALRGTGRLVYVGAGTPGRLAVQDAAELVPTFDLDPRRAIVLLAGGELAGSVAIEGAEDDGATARADVDAAGIGPADVVVGISASGRTPYVLAALVRAAERGAATVGVGNVSDSPLSRLADIAVDLPTGPEVIAGSTRLGAGTAQKIALNTLSTAALVRAGATFGPWMVDVRATNDKLRRRCVRIVRDAAGVDEATAASALTAAEGVTAVALVMLLGHVDVATARAHLADGGSVRSALTEVAACV